MYQNFVRVWAIIGTVLGVARGNCGKSCFGALQKRLDSGKGSSSVVASRTLTKTITSGLRTFCLVIYANRKKGKHVKPSIHWQRNFPASRRKFPVPLGSQRTDRPGATPLWRSCGSKSTTCCCAHSPSRRITCRDSYTISNADQ